MKTGSQSFFSQKVNWQMNKLGLAIHLKNFEGNVELYDNVFNDTRLNFDDFCEYSLDDGAEYFKIYSSDANWTDID
jgi:hypothetical protein